MSPMMWMISVPKPTILKKLADLGLACVAYLDRRIHGLKLRSVETDANEFILDFACRIVAP